MKRCITGAEAERLYKARRFQELVGIGREATPSDIKTACRQALLQYHPDKGGDEEVFKWIRPATEILLLDENLCTFAGRVPSWAKIQLVNLAELRRDITASASRLEVARSKMETTRSDPVRARAQKDALMAERGLSNLRSILTDELKRFHGCYTEHKQIEKERRDEATAREAKAATERALLARRYRGVVKALRQRHQGNRTRFPSMPAAVTDWRRRVTLGVIQTDYLKVVSTMRKRALGGGDTVELVSKSNELLSAAHALVDQCCNEIHALVTTQGKRFPVLPATDPRAPALAKLNKEQRRLTQRIKRNTPYAQVDDIHRQIELVIDQALTILKSTDDVTVL